MKFRNGLALLLRSEDVVFALTDHQRVQLTNPSSHNIHFAVTNTTALPKADDVFNIPAVPVSAPCTRSG
jgi:hypothetical protein